MHGVLALAGVLESYAARGVFRSFSRTGEREFRFRWLWNLPFSIRLEGKSLRFDNVLTNVPAASTLYKELRAFLKDCAAVERPAHRRIDPGQVRVRCLNRRGKVSLAFDIAGCDYEFAARKAVQTVNEVFLSFLAVEHPQYLVEEFRIGEQ
jgi:hypothetical protein